MTDAPALAVEPSTLLDCAGVARALAQRGLRSRKGPLTPARIRSWAESKKLPMWKAPHGQYVIEGAALNIWIARQQADAMRAADEAQQPKQRGR